VEIIEIDRRACPKKDRQEGRSMAMMVEALLSRVYTGSKELHSYKRA